MSTPKNIEAYEKGLFDIVKFIATTGRHVTLPFPTQKKARGFVLRWNGFLGALKRSRLEAIYIQAAGILRGEPFLGPEDKYYVLLKSRDESDLSETIGASLEEAGWNPDLPVPVEEPIQVETPDEMKEVLDRIYKKGRPSDD